MATKLRTVADIIADIDAESAASLIGHNGAPAEPTPFELTSKAIEDVRLEAGNWLTGEAIATQDEADWIDSLLVMVKAAEKLTDANRKTENEPFDTGKAAVQAAYNPLLKQADTIKTTLLAALTPWKNKLAADKAIAAKIAQDAADRAAMIAHKARQAMDAGNLAQREQAEALVASAEAAQRAAAKAAKPTATGLRTTHVAELTDPLEFWKWMRTHRRPDVIEWLEGWADREVKAQKCNLPGVICRVVMVAA